MIIEFDIPDEMCDVLEPYRVNAITQVLAHAMSEHIRLSMNFAMSGAMRWPIGMRPEVLLSNKVRAI